MDGVESSFKFVGCDFEVPKEKDDIEALREWERA